MILVVVRVYEEVDPGDNLSFDEDDDSRHESARSGDLGARTRDLVVHRRHCLARSCVMSDNDIDAVARFCDRLEATAMTGSVIAMVRGSRGGTASVGSCQVSIEQSSFSSGAGPQLPHRRGIHRKEPRMKAEVRRKLEMAGRVRVFSRAHPFSDASYASVLAQFEERLQRAATLEEQERAGRVTSRAATKRRKELRGWVQSELLRHLSRVGGVVGKDTPEVAERFRLPLPNASYQTFLAAARGMLAEARKSKEQLAKMGLTEGILEELTKSVEEFEEATEAARTGRLGHVGARADLQAVTGDLVELVGVLDGVNRFRFREDPELLAAWESARNVVGPFKRSSEKPVAGPGSGPTPGDGLATAA